MFVCNMLSNFEDGIAYCEAIVMYLAMRDLGYKGAPPHAIGNHSTVIMDGGGVGVRGGGG